MKKVLTFMLDIILGIVFFGIIVLGLGLVLTLIMSMIDLILTATSRLLNTIGSLIGINTNEVDILSWVMILIIAVLMSGLIGPLLKDMGKDIRESIVDKIKSIKKGSDK